jgi:alpha-amylase/alpha-mannosidase (GH57 family)
LSNKYICIHGHFYQPPRENAWLEQIEVQESAAPFHDWNERINEECYGPNAHARILNGNGKIVDITNNYERISFNMGPTLLSWMELNRPETYQLILEADKNSLERFNGHGSAIAQVYNHMIMPLASKRDKETQIKWGLYDFEKRFNRKSEGIWLAETACDTDTLKSLYDNGVKYTILAPNQAKRFKLDGQWRDGINPNQPYVVNLGENRQMVLFFYNGEVSQGVAFKGLLNDGKRFAEDLLGSFNGKENEPELLNIATDGESYGHHHRLGEMALAYCLHHIENNSEAELINYGAYLDKHEPVLEAEIHENSSWSCAHGVERWRSNCGCHTGGQEGWDQKWRKPLREGLDWLKETLDQEYFHQMKNYGNDPWMLRDKYIEVIYSIKDRDHESFFKKYLPSIKDEDKTKVVRLLEMQRNGMLMYTSCGWFFNDASGIETTQILQYANRAIQLLEQESELVVEEHFLEILEEGYSNLPEFGSLRDIYRKYVSPKRMSLSKVGMHYAVHVLFDKEEETAKQVFNYNIETADFKRIKVGQYILCMGRAIVNSKVTLSTKYMSFAVVYLGNHHIIGGTSDDFEPELFKAKAASLEEDFRSSNLSLVIHDLNWEFDHTRFSFFDLMRDEQKKILDEVIDNNVKDAVNSISRISNQNYGLLNLMREQELVLPAVLWQNLQVKLYYDFDLAIKALKHKGLYKKMFSAIDELSKWELKLEPRFNYKVKRAFDYLVERDEVKPNETIRLLDTLETLGLEINLIRLQNHVFHKMKNGEANNWQPLAQRIFLEA